MTAPRSGLSWLQAIVLAAAACFLGFAAALFFQRDDAPGAASVEVGFAQDMITHHEQAVEMASLVVNNGESPVVRAFAKEIMKFQAYEIGLMDGWLMDWGYSRSSRSDQAMAWMAEHAATHTGDAQVRELAARIARNQAVEINEYAQTAERLGLDADIERYEAGETETDDVHGG